MWTCQTGAESQRSGFCIRAPVEGAAAQSSASFPVDGTGLQAESLSYSHLLDSADPNDGMRDLSLDSDQDLDSMKPLMLDCWGPIYWKGHFSASDFSRLSYNDSVSSVCNSFCKQSSVFLGMYSDRARCLSSLQRRQLMGPWCRKAPSYRKSFNEDVDPQMTRSLGSLWTI